MSAALFLSISIPVGRKLANRALPVKSGNTYTSPFKFAHNTLRILPGWSVSCLYFDTPMKVSHIVIMSHIMSNIFIDNQVCCSLQFKWIKFGCLLCLALD